MPLDQFYAATRETDGHQRMCKECQKAHSREYSVAHPEWRSEYNRRWQEENRDYVLAQRAITAESKRASNRAWKRSHHEMVNASTRTRKAVIRGCTGTHTADDVLAQFERQNGRCYWCGCRLGPYHVDHVIPLSKGGSNGPENIVASCPPCNLSKNAKMPSEFAGRLC
jgi:5-methylcytosine-specific restriction endonuclease McrA